MVKDTDFLQNEYLYTLNMINNNTLLLLLLLLSRFSRVRLCVTP